MKKSTYRYHLKGMIAELQKLLRDAQHEHATELRYRIERLRAELSAFDRSQRMQGE